MRKNKASIIIIPKSDKEEKKYKTNIPHEQRDKNQQILTNQTQQCIKGQNAQPSAFTPRMQDWFNTKKSTNVIHKNMKEEPYEHVNKYS